MEHLGLVLYLSISIIFKKFIWRPVYDHRNAQKRSSNACQSAVHDYVNVTPNQTRQDDEPPYEDIMQLGHTQHGPDAGQYDSLNPQTQGLEPQYDVISRPQTDVPTYVNRDESFYSASA